MNISLNEKVPGRVNQVRSTQTLPIRQIICPRAYCMSLCYGTPSTHPQSLYALGVVAFDHGIRSVGVGGAQPLKQQSGAFRRWVHCACARRLATRRRSPQCAPDSEVIGPMPMHLAMHLPQGPIARFRHAVARRIALSSGRALSFGSTGPGIRGSRLRLLRRRRCARLGGLAKCLGRAYVVDIIEI
jgi:hypothetical protein